MAKTPTEIRSLARKHTEAAMRTLAAIMVEPSAPAAARVAAANTILDRGWGKAIQTIEATIDDKRDAADWSRSELVAFLNDASKSGEGAAKASRRGEGSDIVH